MGFFSSLNSATSSTLNSVGTTAEALDHVAKTGLYKAQQSSVVSRLEAAQETAKRIEELGGRDNAKKALEDFNDLLSDLDTLR